MNDILISCRRVVEISIPGNVVALLGQAVSLMVRDLNYQISFQEDNFDSEESHWLAACAAEKRKSLERWHNALMNANERVIDDEKYAEKEGSK